MASTTQTGRAVGAVLGSLVADAAACPLHWIYNIQKLDDILANNPSPAFISPSQCPFYNIPTGSFSCYGDQTFVLLQSLVEKKGFDKEDYKQRLDSTFGAYIPEYYDEEGKPTSGERPVYHPWMNRSVIGFLSNYRAGNDVTGLNDSQGDGMAKIAPIVALYAGRPELLSIVEEVVRVTQDNDVAVQYAQAAARLVERVILTGKQEGSTNSLLRDCSDDITFQVGIVLDMKASDHRAAVKQFGSACGLPGSFKSALHSLVNPLSATDFVSGVIPTMVAGGDNCARVSFVGSFVGALVGADNIPQEWINKTARGLEIKDLAEKLILQ